VSDDKPAASSDFAAASANLRETAKWLVGGVVATSVGVLAGSPLTKLGSLEWAPRLCLALGGAVVTLVLLGVLMWIGLTVIATEAINLRRLATLKGWEGRRVQRVAKQFTDRWPGKARGIADVLAKSDALYKAADGKRETDPEWVALAGFQSDLDLLMAEVAFEYKRDRLGELRATLFVLGPVIVLAVAVYAWAANPPDDPKPLSSQPRLTGLTLDAAEALTQSSSLSVACYPSAEPGRIRLSLVVTAEYPGRTELITLPAVAGCAPVRLVEQNSRVFVPK
jgi:hypothetical protein